MLILDQPYVSALLEETAQEMKTPILDNGQVFNLKQNHNLNLLTEEQFLQWTGKQDPLKLYCNSENSINWITHNLSHTKIPAYINFCKDKVTFREKINPLYPDFYFQAIAFKDIKQLDITSIKKPFIIKPAVGFFSIGVYKVTRDNEWQNILALLVQDIQAAKGLYPEEVMNASKFIIEECIDGNEFAIDAYYNDLGNPVILNILKHPFSSETDVSDRIYYTSKEIVLTYLESFKEVLQKIGDIAGFSNFPVHAEVRVAQDGTVVPIEFNPMRFAGWCVTDIAYFAYGINTYEYYLNNKIPQWDALLKDKDDKIFSLVLADVPENVKTENIQWFDYEALSARLNKVIELRKIDFHKYPVFAFLFIETSAQSKELEMVLDMDFGEFIHERKQLNLSSNRQKG